MRFHHIGIAVSNIEKEVPLYILLGAKLVGDAVLDPRQKVRLQLLEMGGQLIELVSPIEKDIPSPVNGYIQRKIRIYHTCYEVIDINQAITKSLESGCIEVVKPTPAVLFGERLVAFVMTPKGDLIEFLNGEL